MIYSFLQKFAFSENVFFLFFFKKPSISEVFLQTITSDFFSKAHSSAHGHHKPTLSTSFSNKGSWIGMKKEPYHIGGKKYYQVWILDTYLIVLVKVVAVGTQIIRSNIA